MSPAKPRKSTRIGSRYLIILATIAVLIVMIVMLVLLSSPQDLTGATVLGIQAAASTTACGDVRQSITLTSNITYQGTLLGGFTTCFLINASNIILDGAGFTVTGNSTSTGVLNPGVFNNITVRNMRIYNFTTNIRMQNSANITIFNNTIEPVNVSATQIGIIIQNVTTVNITNNSIILRDATTASKSIYIQDCVGSGSVYANSVVVSGNDSMGIQTENCNSTTILSNIIQMTGTRFHGILLNYSSWSNLTLNNLSSTPSGINYNIRTRNSQNNIVSLNVINDTVGNTLGSGIYDENELYDTVKENSIRTRSSIGITFSGNHSTIESNLINTSGESANGISISGRNNTVVSNYIIVTGGASGPGDGLSINLLSNSSTYINNNITATLGIEISDGSGVGTVNYFIYNNSFGEIRWTNETVLDNFDINASNDQGLGLGKNIFIGNNTIAVNTSGFGVTIEGLTTGLPTKINTSANITLRGIALGTISQIRRVENFTTASGDIIAAGTNCASPSCDNISYNATSGILTFNITSFSSFAAQDTAPPSVTIATPTNGSNVSGGNRLFNVSITDAYPDQVIFSFDNATGRPFNVTSSQESAPNANFVSFWSATVNLSTVVEGLNRMTVLANDTSGNYNRTESVQFTVDRTPPNVTTFTANFTNSSNFSSTTAFKFEFNMTANDSTTFVSSARFGLNNGNGTETNLSGTRNSTQWMAELVVSSISDGVYTVTPYATDSLNNTNNTAGVITFRLDRMPPNVTTFTANFTNNSNFSAAYKVEFNITANDTTTYVQVVRFGLNNGNGTETNLSGTRNSTQWMAELVLSSMTDGVYTVTPYAADSVNNINNTGGVITFRLDKTPPNVTTLLFHNYTDYINLSPGLSSNSVSLNATVNDSTMTVLNVLFGINSSNGTMFNISASRYQGRWNATINLSLLTEGIHSARVYANDTVGNVNNSQYVTFLVNRTEQVDSGSSSGSSGSGGGSSRSSTIPTTTTAATGEPVSLPEVLVTPTGPCRFDSDCPDNQYCVNSLCNEVFDLKIIGIDLISPNKLYFTYSIKNIAGMEGDVQVEFWVADTTGRTLASGSDVIFVSGTRVQESGVLYLNSELPAAQYTLNLRLLFRNYEGVAFRTFEFSEEQAAQFAVGREREKSASQANLFGGAIGGIFTQFKGYGLGWLAAVTSIILVGLATVLLLKRRAKNDEQQGEEWIAEMFHKQHSQQEIISLLRQQQWQDEEIKVALASVRAQQELQQNYEISSEEMKRLKKFIKASAAHGFDQEKIMAALVQEGWDQNVVKPLVAAWGRAPGNLGDLNDLNDGFKSR